MTRRVVSAISGLWIAFVASGCAAPLALQDNDALAVLPYRAGPFGQIVVQATIDGQGPFDLALDTGASISVVFDHTRDQLNLNLLPNQNVRVHGMVSSGEFPMTSINRIEVGHANWIDARIAVMPGETRASESLDGILGLDFLSRYAIALSRVDEVVRLYDPALVAARTYWHWVSVPLRELRIGTGETTAYAIEFSILNYTLPALFDLGTSENLMNWRAARAIGATPRRTSRDPHDISGTLDSETVITELQVAEMLISDLHWRNTTFLIADFPIFDVLNLDHRPIAIAGANLFGDRDLIVDIERKRLLIRLRRD